MIFLVSCRPTHPGCSFCDDLHCWLKLKTFEDFATVQTFFKCQSASALKMRFENCQGIANSKLGSIRARFWLLPDIDVRDVRDVRDTRSHQHNGSVKKPNTCQGARPPWYYLDRSGTVYRCGIQATTLHLQLHGFHMDISCRVSYGYIHICIIVLYYIILYYFILFYIILYYIILYYVILKYIILHYIILYYFKLFYIILYCIILYYITLHYIYILHIYIYILYIYIYIIHIYILYIYI